MEWNFSWCIDFFRSPRIYGIQLQVGLIKDNEEHKMNASSSVTVVNIMLQFEDLISVHKKKHLLTSFRSVPDPYQVEMT